MADPDETTAFELVEEKKNEEKDEDEDAPVYGTPLQTPPPTPARPNSASRGGESSRYSRIKGRILELLPDSIADRLEDFLDDLETDPARRRCFLLIILAVKVLLLLLIIFIVLAVSSSKDGRCSPLQQLDLVLRESFDPSKASARISTSNQSSTSTSPTPLPQPQSLPDLYKLATKTEDPAHQAAFVRELMRSIWNVTLTHLLNEESTSTEQTLQRTALLARALPTLATLDLGDELVLAEGWLKATCGVSGFWDNLDPKSSEDLLEDYLQAVLACYQETGNQTALTKAKEILEKEVGKFRNFSTDLRVRIPSLQQSTLKAFEARSSADLLADFVKFCYRGPPQNETFSNSSNLPPLAYLRVLVPLHLQSKLPWHLVTKYQSLISSIISRKLWTDINQDNPFDFSRSCGGELKFEMASSDCDLGGLLGLAWAASPGNFPEIGGGERVLETARGIAGGCETVSAKGNGLTAKVFEMTSSGRWIGMGRGSGVSHELLYSYLVLYRLTGDGRYRAAAFQAASTLYRLALDFGTEHFGGRLLTELVDLERTPTALEALRQSRLLSRTLRYLYLIFKAGSHGSSGGGSAEEKLDDLKQWLIRGDGNGSSSVVVPL